MYSYTVRAPKDRIAVIIGENGKTKREIEEATKSVLDIDSTEGDITITGDEALLLYTAQHVIKAIARGFNPDIAMRLLKQDYIFELLDLTEWSDKKNQQQRMKGRVIGMGGKSRRVIEELAECNISVYGKTVGIIAPADTIAMAKTAVVNLLDGATHASVFKMLERMRRDAKMRELVGNKIRK